MFCYQRDLLQVPILLKATVAGIGKMKEKVIKSFYTSKNKVNQTK